MVFVTQCQQLMKHCVSVCLLSMSFYWSVDGYHYSVGGFDEALGDHNWVNPNTDGRNYVSISSTSYQTWADGLEFYYTDTLEFRYNASLHSIVVVPTEHEMLSCTHDKSTYLYYDKTGNTSVAAKSRLAGKSIWYVISAWTPGDCVSGMRFKLLVRGTVSVEQPVHVSPLRRFLQTTSTDTSFGSGINQGTSSGNDVSDVGKSFNDTFRFAVVASVIGSVITAIIIVYFIIRSQRNAHHQRINTLPNGATIEGEPTSINRGSANLTLWVRSKDALKDRLAQRRGICPIYSLDELQRASNYFSQDNEIGKGGFGTVYKGILEDGTVVAIKRSKSGDTDAEQFFNEVSILSQVNNRNLVKLLGCCVEEEVPLLVYEFIPNGSLDALVHARDGYKSKLDWPMRFRIAIQTADALNYLHFQASSPIIHRDVKTANILVDKNFNAKVADFGLSKFLQMDATHISTVVKGTPGYLDPEYYQTFQLTDKTDVYSFGVVLLELVTSKKAVDPAEAPGFQNLVARCTPYIRSGRSRDIIDQNLIIDDDDNDFYTMEGVLQIALVCLNSERATRPSMDEVVEMLAKLKGTTTSKNFFQNEIQRIDPRAKEIEIQERYNFIFSRNDEVPRIDEKPMLGLQSFHSSENMIDINIISDQIQ